MRNTIHCSVINVKKHSHLHTNESRHIFFDPHVFIHIFTKKYTREKSKRQNNTKKLHRIDVQEQRELNGVCFKYLLSIVICSIFQFIKEKDKIRLKVKILYQRNRCLFGVSNRWKLIQIQSSTNHTTLCFSLKY